MLNAYSSLTVGPGEPDPRPSQSMLEWLRGRGTPWPGPSGADDTRAGREVRAERGRSGPEGVKFPWFLPYFDEGQSLGETAAMRQAYRRMLGEANVRAALLGQILAVAQLDLQVQPVDKKDRAAVGDADLVRWNLEEGLEGGVPGLIWSVLSGGLLDGYSVSEKVWDRENSGQYRGAYYLRVVKPKDAGSDVILVTDEYRNVLSVRGLRYNGGEEFSPANFVIYRHLPLFDTPTGTSALRAAYRAWWFLDTVMKLRAMGLEKRALPVIMAEIESPSDRPSVEQSLAMVRSQNWLTVPAGVRVQALDIAGGADSQFDSAINQLTEEIFLAIAGATLQAKAGDVGNARGSSREHRATADLFVWHLSVAIQQLLNDRRRGLVKDIVDLNRAAPAYPKVTLSAVSDRDLEGELSVARGLWEMGVSLSLNELRERFAFEPPDADDPSDSLGGKADQEAQLAASAAAAPGGPGGAAAADRVLRDEASIGGQSMAGMIPGAPTPGAAMDEGAPPEGPERPTAAGQTRPPGGARPPAQPPEPPPGSPPPGRAAAETAGPAAAGPGWAREVLGRDASHADLESLGGSEGHPEVRYSPATGRLKVSSMGDHHESTFTLSRTRGGDVEADYGYIGVDPDRRGSPLAANVLASQLLAMKRLGVRRVHASAGRGGGMIGYKVWPKFGFDGVLPPETLDALPGHLRGAETIQQLYAKPGGREWWEENGESIDVSLDLENADRALRLIERMRGRKAASEFMEFAEALNGFGRGERFDEGVPPADPRGRLLPPPAGQPEQPAATKTPTPAPYVGVAAARQRAEQEEAARKQKKQARYEDFQRRAAAKAAQAPAQSAPEPPPDDLLSRLELRLVNATGERGEKAVKAAKSAAAQAVGFKARLDAIPDALDDLAVETLRAGGVGDEGIARAKQVSRFLNAAASGALELGRMVGDLAGTAAGVRGPDDALAQAVVEKLSPGDLALILYSGVANPAATMRAAREWLARRRKGPQQQQATTMSERGDAREASRLAARALSGLNEQDAGLLTAFIFAAAEAGGDVAGAVREAVEAFEEFRASGQKLAETGIDEPMHTGVGVDKAGRKYATALGKQVPVPEGAKMVEDAVGIFTQPPRKEFIAGAKMDEPQGGARPEVRRPDAPPPEPPQPGDAGQAAPPAATPAGRGPAPDSPEAAPAAAGRPDPAADWRAAVDAAEKAAPAKEGNERFYAIHAAMHRAFEGMPGELKSYEPGDGYGVPEAVHVKRVGTSEAGRPLYLVAQSDGGRMIMASHSWGRGPAEEASAGSSFPGGRLPDPAQVGRGRLAGLAAAGDKKQVAAALRDAGRSVYDLHLDSPAAEAAVMIGTFPAVVKRIRENLYTVIELGEKPRLTEKVPRYVLRAVDEAERRRAARPRPAGEKMGEPPVKKKPTATRRQLEALPGRYGQAVRLKYVEGLKTAQIAERLGVSVEDAEAWLAYGHRRLLQMVRKHAERGG